jgi:hypothetical protein
MSSKKAKSDRSGDQKRDSSERREVPGESEIKSDGSASAFGGTETVEDEQDDAAFPGQETDSQETNNSPTLRPDDENETSVY